MANLNAPTARNFARSSNDGATIAQEFSYADGAAAADVIRFATLPAGTRVDDLQVSADAANASVTVSAGWAYVDGSAAAAAEFIAAGTALATATLIRANTTGARTVLAKDAYLTLTVAGGPIAGTVLRARPFVTNVGVR